MTYRLSNEHVVESKVVHGDRYEVTSIALLQARAMEEVCGVKGRSPSTRPSTPWSHFPTMNVFE